MYFIPARWRFSSVYSDAVSARDTVETILFSFFFFPFFFSRRESRPISRRPQSGRISAGKLGHKEFHLLGPSGRKLAMDQKCQIKKVFKVGEFVVTFFLFFFIFFEDVDRKINGDIFDENRERKGYRSTMFCFYYRI